MTTILDLHPTWVNSATDPSDYLFLHKTTSLTRTKGVEVRLQRTASGRTRAIRQAGKSETWSLNFSRITLDDEEWLEDHLGETLCFRDDRGHKMWGVFDSMPVEEVPAPNRSGDLTLSIQQITFSEAV